MRAPKWERRPQRCGLGVLRPQTRVSSYARSLAAPGHGDGGLVALVGLCPVSSFWKGPGD